MNTIIRDARRMIIHEWQRRVFDAFMLPAESLNLTDSELKNYTKQALKYSGHIDWERYDRTRTSFLDLAEDLLKVRPMPFGEMHELREKMYVRFMEGRIRFFEYLEKQEKCEIPAIQVGEADFHNTELAAVFAHLPDQPDVKTMLSHIEVNWNYEQLHMVSWFSGQLSLGQGKYSRSRPNHSARVTYQRLLNPYSLLWIAAALGIDPEMVRKAASEAEWRTTFKEKCIAIRNLIPFSRIYELALPLVEKERNGV